MNFGADYTKGNLIANLKLTRFGKVKLVNWSDNGDSVADHGEVDTYNPKITVDLSAGYNHRNFTLTLGGVNLLNAYPDKQNPGLTESGGIWDAVQMGFSGTLYYARLEFKF